MKVKARNLIKGWPWPKSTVIARIALSDPTDTEENYDPNPWARIFAHIHGTDPAAALEEAKNNLRREMYYKGFQFGSDREEGTAWRPKGNLVSNRANLPRLSNASDAAGV